MNLRVNTSVDTYGDTTFTEACQLYHHKCFGIKKHLIAVGTKFFLNFSVLQTGKSNQLF